MNLKEQINNAVTAHVNWKTRLKTAINSGKSDLSPDQVSQDNQCDFGRWLYGPAKTQYGQSPNYDACCKLHAEFHKHTGAILKMALAGQKDKAMAEMDSHSKFAGVSTDLVGALMKWNREEGNK